VSNTSVTQQPGAHRATGSAEAQRYLRFTLNDELYALNIFHITELLEHRQLTAVPMMPEFIRGVINLRGKVVPVIDLAIRFGRGVTTIARRTSIIIVRIHNPATVGADGLSTPAGGGPAPDGGDPPGADAGTQDIGILVDAVNKVVRLTPDEIEPAPAFGAGIRADYISGMAKRDHDFVIILDIERVLSIADMVSLHNAVADPAATAPAALEAGTASRTPRSS
jgi:purine-binding chemotaxis protein CheW